MKKSFVYITVLLLCMFLGCIPIVIGGAVEQFYHNMAETIVCVMIANKVVKWVFRESEGRNE